jgi:hypothetical protein
MNYLSLEQLMKSLKGGLDQMEHEMQILKKRMDKDGSALKIIKVEYDIQRDIYNKFILLKSVLPEKTSIDFKCPDDSENKEYIRGQEYRYEV